jgi:hypothetical protein
MNSDREYIGFCKRQIVEKFGFKKTDGSPRQRDLEYLAACIEEKSGIKISLSTLKRLWKKDYDQTPHPATLDAFVSLLGYENWQAFKLKNSIQSGTVAQKNENVKRWMVWPVLGALVIVFWLIAFRNREPGTGNPVINGPIKFEGNKTVSQGVPNTIIFNYDLSNVEADSFFFQQSWNDREKVTIDPKIHYYSNIYYFPGFHKAKLIANDSIVSRFRAHVTTDGWLPLVRYSFDETIPTYVKKENQFKAGTLHITREDLISSGVDVSKDYLLSYFNVREFENTHSDNFSLETRVAFDSTSRACPGLEIVVLCEVHIFFVRLMGKGCERDVTIKMGEVVENGVNNDFSAFGRDLKQWQNVKIEVINKKAVIYLDNKEVHTVSFKSDLGKVVGLVYNFNGTGAVNYARLRNGEGKEVMNEQFDGSKKISL